MQEASAALERHQELPVQLRLADGRLLEGAVDLAFSDGRQWTIVDFKTGRADEGRYRRQLALYGAALAKATGLPVRGVLFQL
jgi:ATP-dependent exoDNAse (exonuclease V) beta subunit